MDTKLLGLILQGDKKNEREFNRIKETYEELSKSKANTITSSANGESIVLSDSSDSKLDSLRVMGKTEQFTTTGAQLLDISNFSILSGSGVKTVVNNDGSITVNGTPTNQYVTVAYSSKLNLEPGDYYTSGGENAGGSVYAQASVTLSDGTVTYNINKPFTIDGTEQKVIFSIQTGAKLDAINNYTIYPMLNKGSTPLPYEPYTGGIPSPNPQYPQRLEIIGTSKNLLPNTAKSQTINGVTFTVNDDKSVTVNGTATGSCYFAVSGFFTLESGDYILSGCPEGGGGNTYQLYSFKEDNTGYVYDTGNSNKITSLSNEARRVFIAVYNGAVCNNLTFCPMINKGTTVLPYEPYDKGHIEANVYGKNLLDTDFLICKATDTAQYNPVLYTKRWNVEKGKTYTLSFDTENTGVSVYINPLCGFEYKSFTMDGKRHSFTTKVSKSVYHDENMDGNTIIANIGSTAGKSVGNISNVMLTLVDNCDTYEPYKPVQPLTISTPNGLPGIKVTDPSIATYTDEAGQMWCADEIDFERGVYVKRIDTCAFNGEENWSNGYSSNGVDNRFQIQFSNKYKVFGGVFVPAMCNAFSYQKKQGICSTNFFRSTVGTYGGVQQIYVLFNPSTEFIPLEDIDAWKNYLSEHPITIMLPLETPIETSLSESELEAYKSLHTNHPTTTILNDSGAHMEVKYTADKKNYIDNKFAQITNAVLSMGSNI